MSGFVLKVFIGAALVFGAHAQPKPPADKAPAAQEKKPATTKKEGQGLENAVAL
jgi:hypothetical protein